MEVSNETDNGGVAKDISIDSRAVHICLQPPAPCLPRDVTVGNLPKLLLSSLLSVDPTSTPTPPGEEAAVLYSTVLCPSLLLWHERGRQMAHEFDIAMINTLNNLTEVKKKIFPVLDMHRATFQPNPVKVSRSFIGFPDKPSGPRTASGPPGRALRYEDVFFLLSIYSDSQWLWEICRIHEGTFFSQSPFRSSRLLKVATGNTGVHQPATLPQIDGYMY
ncbi:hypothetical protein HOY80DRAFT_985295 [Tuber brumale]|nr:hypothetical protein HOY80DRAFT_985295 [Tuber brumale]